MKRTLIHNATIVNEGQSVPRLGSDRKRAASPKYLQLEASSAHCEEVIEQQAATCCLALSTTMCIFVIRVLPIRQIF